MALGENKLQNDFIYTYFPFLLKKRKNGETSKLCMSICVNKEKQKGYTLNNITFRVGFGRMKEEYLYISI